MRIVIWGTGKVASDIMNNCKTIEIYDIEGFIDNDTSRQGKTFLGYHIYSPTILNYKEFDRIVVMSNFYDEICSQINDDYPNYTGRVENKYFFFKESIYKRYLGTEDAEIKEVLQYISNNDLSVFNYSFKKKYEYIDADIEFDSEFQLFYVIHNGKRMYMKNEFNSLRSVYDYYKSLLIEQDVESPHRYLVENVSVEENDVVIDIGAAEGIFALDVIDEVSKIYIIECDSGWMDALKITFRNYRNKVVFINGFADSYDEESMFRIDSVIKEPVNFIKMDIEGAEWDALCGAKNLIQLSKNIKFAICAYHRDCDQILIEDFFRNNGIRIMQAKRYMWFPYLCDNKYVSTKLHRGVIHGVKKEK